MRDLSAIDMEEFVEKVESLDALMVSKTSLDRSIKAIREDIANILDVKKNKVVKILEMFANIRQEGEPFDEELVGSIKELYDAYKQEIDE